jgi:hypothetical protein
MKRRDNPPVVVAIEFDDASHKRAHEPLEPCELPR